MTACNGVQLNKDAVPNAMQDYFTHQGLSNAVSILQHPAGEYLNGITYVTYQGLLEDPYVAAYDHNSKTWQGPYKAGVSEMGKDPTRKIDNHGKPAMVIDDEGYIHIVFGGHGGMPKHGKNPLGNHHYGRMQHVVSKNPLDITSWEVLDNIPPFGTYNQFIKMNNGDIYLFYRHGAHRSNWVYQKSTDNGRTFAAPVSVLKTKRRTDIEAEDAWYAWFTKGPNDKIIASVNYHLCWDMAKNHTGERRNGYYIEMDTKDGVWRNVAGEPLNTPLTREEANGKALVVHSGALWTNIGTTTTGANGFPQITFRMGEHMGLKHGGPQNLYHFRWDGQQWRGGMTTDLPVSIGDFVANTADNVSLYLAHKDEKGTAEISKWESLDQGNSFNKTKVLLKRDNAKFEITSLIRNAHPDAQILIAEKSKGTDLVKMYVIGENGPLQRALR